MALTILEQDKIKSVLTAMWKKALNTDQDPANGRWFTNGANNDGKGLYGGLTDSIDTTAIFDMANKNYSPTQRLAASSIVDNRNGLTPSASVTLSYKYADTVSTTHTTSHAVKLGFGFEFKAKAEIFGVGGEATTKFNIEYQYTSSDSKTETQTREHSISQHVPVNVPTGKVYKAVLVAAVQKIDVPYHLNVYVSGQTETWFERQVNGHYNWMLDVGSAFAIAADPQYRREGNTTKGLVTGVTGMLTAQQTADFTVQTWDVTSEFPALKASQPAAAFSQKFAVAPGESLLPEGAMLISSTPVAMKAHV